METQKTLNSQSNLEKEEWSWRNQPSDYTTKLQSSRQYGSGTHTHTKKNQKYRPMEQDRKPRKKPMHLWVPYF